MGQLVSGGTRRVRPASLRLVTIALLVAVAGTALKATAATRPETELAAGLYELIDRRLELMRDVAAHKWRHGLPIENRQREAVVLAAAGADGLRFGLRPRSTEALFLAQIDAAKAVQAHWFDVWRENGAPGPAADLNSVVRPRLIELGERILRAAAAQQNPGGWDLFDATVQVAGLPEQQRTALYRATLGLARFPHRLAQVLQTGVLRVGTTGDYAPFTLQSDGAPLPRGIDIDLAEHLAAGLGVTVRFVATSWPDLLDDLSEGRFDIAMGGVSRTLARQRHGAFSRPYYVGGKTPIVRCTEVADYASLEAIDRPGVRVVVNPGGTNERFVDAHLEHADKQLHEDNRTIFERLVAGAADVMITDQVEVELQAARHPELCASMPGITLTYQEKAYLLPQDPVWLAFVNTWLELALADGTVAEVFHEHGVTPRPPPQNVAPAALSNSP